MLHSEKCKEIQPTKISKNYIANAKQTRSQYQAHSAKEPMTTSASSSALKHTTELHPTPRTREHSTPARSPLQGIRQQLPNHRRQHENAASLFLETNMVQQTIVQQINEVVDESVMMPLIDEETGIVNATV